MRGPTTDGAGVVLQLYFNFKELVERFRGVGPSLPAAELGMLTKAPLQVTCM